MKVPALAQPAHYAFRSLRGGLYGMGDRSIITKKDIRQLESVGKSPGAVEQEIARLTSGFPPTRLLRRCSYDDGVISLALAWHCRKAYSRRGVYKVMRV